MTNRESERGFFVHPTAVIDEPCQIGVGTKIWHFSHVMSRATVGERCIIGQNVFISSGCRIGDGCKIQNNVSIYAGVELEDEVFCGPSMVFTNVINPRAFMERKSEFKSTRVLRGASIGANATILCGVTLGSYCLIGAGAVVTRDVPDYALVYGSPARLKGWVCYCAEPLELGAGSEGQYEGTCSKCGRHYRRAGGSVRQV